MDQSKPKASCPVEVTLRVISGRWKVLVLHFLLERTHRFGELQRRLGAITQRTLTAQLRELERDGIVERAVYAEVPPRVEYSLTPLGRSLHSVLLAMEHWGTENGEQMARQEQASATRQD
jgi:DNA-binding HxlR family transcriptional regulator